MNKLIKLPVMMLAGAMLMSTTAHSSVGDIFYGENGGVREIKAIQFEGDLANITVETTNRKGRVKTRVFHIRRDAEGQYYADSRGTQEFQQFLVAQVQEVRDNLATNAGVINADNTTIWELRDLFPTLDIMAFSDGVDMNEEETLALYNAGVDLDSFWFVYDASHIPDDQVMPFEPDAVDLSLLQEPEVPAMTNEEAYIAFNELRGNTVYTPYEYVSSVDWLTIYNNDVAAREEFNNSGVDSHTALSDEQRAMVDASQAADAAEAADILERTTRLSSRQQRHAGLDEQTRLANLYVVGQADDMTGRERITEFFDMINNQNVEYIESHSRYITDSVERGYEHVNVRGLQAVHQTGWTGQGVEIFVNDNPTHGRTVAEAARFVAPGATILGDQENDFSWSTYSQVGADVVNISSGYQSHSPQYGYHGAADSLSLANYAATGFNTVVDRHPDALFVTSLPNTTSCAGIDFSVCDSQVAGINHGTLNGDWILVGAVGPNYNSAAIGDSEAKYHTVYTSGRSVSGRVYGTSFATPKVTGAAALIMQKYPNLKAGEVKDIILESAFRDFDGYSLERYGRGILDVSAALSPIGGIN